jgi:hypothetical protein
MSFPRKKEQWRKTCRVNGGSCKFTGYIDVDVHATFRECVLPMNQQLAVAIGLGLTANAACYPVFFDSTSETDAVITVEHPTEDYARNRTYVVTSTVYDLRDVIDADRLPPGQPIDRTLEPLVLSEIKRNMDALGYEEETNPESNPPDVGVFVGAVRSTQWVFYYYPAWPPYWGYYPPVYYPPTVVPTGYAFGTLFMAMVPLRDRSIDDALEPIWLGVIDGLLSSSSATNASRVERSINQAFSQSPYLNVEVN